MKKNLLVIGLILGLLSLILIVPRTTSAFWPFDKLFSKGEVKGEQTETGNTNKFGQTVKNFVSGSETLTTEKTELEDSFSEEALVKAVKGKRISEAQRKRLLAKLAVIRAKRQELKKLQEAFIAWMKENRIDPKEFAKPAETISITPAVKKQIKTSPETKPTNQPESDR